MIIDHDLRNGQQRESEYHQASPPLTPLAGLTIAQQAFCGRPIGSAIAAVTKTATEKNDPSIPAGSGGFRNLPLGRYCWQQ
ncbi:MAG TPA: hypothetical protein VHX86_10980 [Tepidisphaeraceae bacterium]|jgi:hypothetical protein|nr:hypothetical protein [Tepidisphaeraceae bacterium]